MKQNLLTLALTAIALVGLPSCSTTTSTATTTTAPTTAATQTQSSIKVGASNSTLGLMKVLQTNYEATTKNVKITNLEPGQSENIIDGVKQTLVDVGAISRTLKPEENDGTLESRDVAHDALIV